MSDLLAPGVRRLRPDDHFMILTDTDETPMQIGALQYYETAPGARARFFEMVKRQVAERLPLTPLMVVLREAPEGFDSDVWVNVDHVDLDDHIQRVSDPLSDRALRGLIGQQVMARLDLARPPFRMVVFDNLQDGRSALYVTVHHSVTDGIGFQSILGLLSDDTPPATEPRRAGRLPSPEAWRTLAEARFTAEAPLREEKRKRKERALAVLKSGELPARAVTPTLKLSGPTSRLRAYDTLSLPLGRIKALGKNLGGTVNDIFLTLGATAIRNYLIAIDDLPADPIVINSARSYRRPEHGQFGNRIVALHPHLATHIADPRERLHAIQASMADELARSQYDEALLDAPEIPFGARDRRAKFAKRTGSGGAILAGNVTLSNVPGPETPRSLAGLRQLANYPTPILGSGRFLNITSRRNGDALDMGIMADPTKITDVSRIAKGLCDALGEYEALTAR